MWHFKETRFISFVTFMIMILLYNIRFHINRKKNEVKCIMLNIILIIFF